MVRPPQAGQPDHVAILALFEDLRARGATGPNPGCNRIRTYHRGHLLASLHVRAAAFNRLGRVLTPWERWICTHDVPEVIVMNRGSEFKKHMKSLMDTCGIRHV